MTTEPATISWPWRIAALVLALPAAGLFALGLAWLLQTESLPFRDLTQDWLSARCYLDGQSVYTPHRVSAPRYLGVRDTGPITVNAHPPPSVLMVLPFGKLPHQRALWTWNVLSLGMTLAGVWLVLGRWGLNCDGWCLLFAICLMTCSGPLATQVKYAQFNPLLLLLIAGGWAAGRRQQPIAAGIAIGLAAAIKLFPAYLLLYFACQRQWRTVVSGVLTIVGSYGICLLVFGPADVFAYFRDVVPAVNEWRSDWLNYSFTGFWSRLFDVSLGKTRELVHNPLLARGLVLLCSALVTLVAGWRAVLAKGQRQQDLAFGTALTAMLLVSPITWDHYLLLLYLPFAVIWYHHRHSLVQLALWPLVVLLGLIPAPVIWKYALPAGPAEPFSSLTIFGLGTYGLCALLALQIVTSRSPQPATETP